MQPLYFVETSSPRIRGPWFLETDRDSNSREFAIKEMRAGGVVKVLEITEPDEYFPEGRCRNVTEDIREEAEAAFPTFNHPSKADLEAARFDHARDLRKEMV